MASPYWRKALLCTAPAPLKYAPKSHDRANSSPVFICNTLKYSARESSKFLRRWVWRISPEQTVLVAAETARQISLVGKLAASSTACAKRQSPSSTEISLPQLAANVGRARRI